MGPGDLDKALRDLPLATDPNIIAGIEHCEDAGVYRLRDDLALIQTVDFFTPIVDDPFTFGRIAAANALSDVYAMGGIPLTVLNIICFPVRTMQLEILREILKGGLATLHEAGVVLLGGHSIEDSELKYGLSVTGTIHPDHVLRNRGGQAGDALVLTKPLGTGIVATAVKGGMAPEELENLSVRSMAALNREAASLVAATHGVHACTDVTGFGLAGHACEMIEESDVGIAIDVKSVPVFPGLQEFVESGILPGGLKRNRSFRAHMVERAPSCPEWLYDVLFDPQTSGGLLVALSPDEAPDLVRKMRDAEIASAAIIGEITSSLRGRILVR